MRDVAYSTNLARIHHQAYGELAGAAADLITTTFSASTHPRVVDLGCGSGILARLLTERGHTVTGVDISETMLDIARTHAPRANFVNDSIYSFDLPDCELVCMTGEVINYIFDDKAGMDAIDDLFERINHSLRPGGILLFDFMTPDIKPADRDQIGDGWSLRVTSSIDPEAVSLQRAIEITTKEEGSPVRELHQARLYKPELLFSHLTEKGFFATAIYGYGTRVFRPGHRGFICEKMHHHTPGAETSWAVRRRKEISAIPGTGEDFL